MDALLAWLHEPLVALFVVAAFGFLLGKVKVRGVGLGVAAVLFVGLAFSATVRHVELPELIPKMGLALFIYAIGLSSGPGFFALFRRRGHRRLRPSGPRSGPARSAEHRAGAAQGVREDP